MNYSSDELFEFLKNSEKTLGGYAVKNYRKRNDRDITEIEIPAEYNGLPVTMLCCECFAYSQHLMHITVPGSVRNISNGAFRGCQRLETVELNEGLINIERYAFGGNIGLKRVKLPKSLKKLGFGVFEFCRELECVEFGCEPPDFGARIFRGCGKLPIETYVMSLVRSIDFTSPIPREDFRQMTKFVFRENCDYFCPEVFEFLAKNRSFRNCNLKFLFEKMIDENIAELFPIAEKYGMLSNRKLVDLLTEYANKHNSTEMTAYFLDLKNRKFGFEKGDNDEL